MSYLATTSWGLSKRDRGGPGSVEGGGRGKYPSMNWAQRLKRVFGSSASKSHSCEHCGGQVKIIASIEEPAVIGGILEHLQRSAAASLAGAAAPRPEARLTYPRDDHQSSGSFSSRMPP